MNDTAVLYTVVKPPKRSPEIIAEKKKDTAIKPAELLQKDTIALVKKQAGKPDSTLVSKNNAKNNDTSRPANKLHAPANQNNVVKSKTAGRDTTLIAKKTEPAPIRAAGKPVAKKDSSLLAVNAAAHKKDSVAKGKKLFSLFGGREKTNVAKADRKDTIILMNSGKPTTVKPLAKAADAKKDSTALALAKRQEAAQKDSSINIGAAVTIDKTPAQNNAVENRKDTVKLVNKTAIARPPVEQKPDTSFNPPAKRLRPFVNKVAELLTDTSYIAVFVDESKEKFDTIRISIPFNELLAFSRMQTTVAAQINAADKKLKETIAQQSVDTGQSLNKKADSIPVSLPLTDRKSTADSNANARSKVTNTDSAAELSARIKTEATNAEKIHADSLKALQQVARNNSPIKDSGIAKRSADSIVVAGVPATAMKNDSVSITDSTRPSKPVAQTALLNTDCKEIASDADIDKLRIKMLVVGTDEDRTALAKRLFKQKCLLTKQVRALSELFKTDEGKYKWLDATYPFVSDAGNFPALGDIIKDEYYLNRFKAMLRH